MVPETLLLIKCLSLLQPTLFVYYLVKPLNSYFETNFIQEVSIETSTPMDVDPGNHLFLLFLFPSLITYLDVSARSTVCLPYSLVPGITIHSPLFFKAISTIAKQHPEQSSASSTSGTAISESEKPFPDFGVG